jgi:tetratricopeptide (TPR) repeat protein
MKRSLIIVAAALAASGLHAAQVLLPNGSTIEGSEIRARPDGTVVLTTAQGQREFPKGQYTKAIADKPAEFDQAGQLAAQKKYDEAIKLLADVIVKYRYLEWDNRARAASAQIMVAKGDPAGAADMYEQMFRTSPDTKNESKLLWGYLNALLLAQKTDKLSPQLDEIIAKGSRADAAKAQTMRGDIKAGQGQMEGAVLDYLRTVVLFQAEADAQPEALFKAGEALEKLRDPRAKEMYAKLVQNYPASDYAQKARGKAQ